jgi:SCY1-like protein 1
MPHPKENTQLSSDQTETYIYIATERVVPLRWHVRRKSLAPETIKWGLHGIAVRIMSLFQRENKKNPFVNE